MPVLAAEPEVYPEELLTCSPRPGPRRWWVMHVKPRQEKAVSRQLRVLGIAHYLPMFGRRVRVGGGIRISRIPLFPSYLFVHANAEARTATLATNRVVRALDVADQQGLDDDLRQIHRLLNSGLPITPEDDLVKGIQVEVISGPMAGIRGVVLRRTSGHRLLVKVDFIQRGASVEIDDDALLPVGPTGRRLATTSHARTSINCPEA